MTEEILKLASKDLSKIFSLALKDKELKISFNWNVSEKTVSEIGGRLIEDFILTSLPEAINHKTKDFSGSFIKCSIPDSARSMEDLSFNWVAPNGETNIALLVDVKGHNETKSGSRPNLASIRKCKEFYKKNENKELWIFYCRYTPIVKKELTDSYITYKIEEASFEEKGIFLLRSLSDNNMDPANIGSGGQILFARENNITLVDRSRDEMLEFLDLLSVKLEDLSNSKKEKVE